VSVVRTRTRRPGSQPSMRGAAGPSVHTTSTSPSASSSALPAYVGSRAGWMTTPIDGADPALSRMAEAHTDRTATGTSAGLTPTSDPNAPASSGSSSVGADERTANEPPSACSAGRASTGSGSGASMTSSLPACTPRVTARA